MTDHQKQLLDVLGKNFKGTLIQDPNLEPYFIVRYAEGGFGVMKTRLDAKGNLKYRAVGYPSTFVSSLDMIAREKQHEEGRVFNTVQEYIDNWKAVCREIQNIYTKWDIKNI